MGAAWLQIVGATCELAGIGTVAAGISQVRVKYTGQAIFVVRWARAAEATVRRIIARFRKQPTNVVVGAGTLRISPTFGRGRITVTIGEWGDDVDITERVERLRVRANELTEQLSVFTARVADEADARKDAEAGVAKAQVALGQEVDRLIRDAVAGGLQLETVGVCFFALGVVLQTVGNVL